MGLGFHRQPKMQSGTCSDVSDREFRKEDVLHIGAIQSTKSVHANSGISTLPSGHQVSSFLQDYPTLTEFPHDNGIANLPSLLNSPLWQLDLTSAGLIRQASN